MVLTLRFTDKYRSAIMRVFCLVTAFSSFLVGRADSHADGGPSNATFVTPGSLPRLHNTAFKILGLLQLDGSMDKVASEDRMPDKNWMLTAVKKLGFDYDQLMLRLNNDNYAFSIDERDAVQAYVRFVEDNNKPKMKSRDHKVALDTLVSEKTMTLPDGVEGKAIDERAQAQVVALLRAAANFLRPSSNAVAEKLTELKIKPEDALQALGLDSGDALTKSPNAAVQWLKYIVLFSKQKSAELAKAEVGEVKPKWHQRAFYKSKAKADTKAAFMNLAARLLFHNKPYDDVTNFIKAATKIPELKKWVYVMRKHIPKPSTVVEP